MPESLFYYAQEDQEVGGPIDLVQMAGLLRAGAITADTMTLLEGEFHWQPFGHRAQFIVAREMSVHATSRNLEEIKANAPRGIVPLPSKETLINALIAAAKLLAIATFVFLLSYLEPKVGFIFMVVGIGMAAVGHCLILSRLLDEDVFTLLALIFIPLYDIYFFIANLDAYYAHFRIKYVGVVMAVAAGLGVARNSSSDAKDILQFFGL